MEIFIVVVMVLLGTGLVYFIDIYDKEILEKRRNGERLGTFHKKVDGVVYEYIVYAKVIEVEGD